MLNELHLRHVGPAPRFDIEFAERLNIFTGDNGLGKSFLLDVAWWALTGKWSDQAAYPQQFEDAQPEIALTVDDSDETYSFSFSDLRWESPKLSLRKLQDIVIYARADGGFSVVDPARKPALTYHFTPDKLWNGLRSGGKVLCNGLIQDWVSWQRQPDPTIFEHLTQIIHQLSPHAGEWMEPGEPTRISLDDVRDMPTIRLPYDTIPVTYASAGMKRILSLAYLMVWTWYEHQQAAKLRKRKPSDHLVLLIDEIEAHLHPQWQRTILPAVLEVATNLRQSEQMQVQALITTHAPLVLASVEPIFDEECDRLFLFDLADDQVRLEEVPWSKQGDTVGWLTSDAFGLRQARSKEAEEAIESAEAFMRGVAMDSFPEHLQSRDQIHQELQRVLPCHDPFWPRWIVTDGRVSV